MKTTADYMQLDVREFKRKGALNPGARGTVSRVFPSGQESSIGFSAHVGRVVLSYSIPDVLGRKSITENIPLAETPCFFGGTRPWFECPTCGRRVAILYGGHRFACRTCTGVGYETLSMDYLDRLYAARRKLFRRLKPIPGTGEYRRPKGMHHLTYDRIAEDVRTLSDKISHETFRRLRMSEEMIDRLQARMAKVPSPAR